MRKKGVKFPDQYDETKVPVLTPPPEPARRGDTSSVSSTSSALAGLSRSELVHVATNVVDMFEDMLHEATKEDSSISSHGVIRELAQQARELVQRMEGVIQSAVTDGSEVRVCLCDAVRFARLTTSCRTVGCRCCRPPEPRELLDGERQPARSAQEVRRSVKCEQSARRALVRQEAWDATRQLGTRQ